jgi:hypothetical protein
MLQEKHTLSPITERKQRKELQLPFGYLLIAGIIGSIENPGYT